ncbi:hypothetical protein Hanom_Chr07g00629361 [Helianthus anomalus]
MNIWDLVSVPNGYRISHTDFLVPTSWSFRYRYFPYGTSILPKVTHKYRYWYCPEHCTEHFQYRYQRA